MQGSGYDATRTAPGSSNAGGGALCWRSSQAAQPTEKTCHWSPVLSTHG